MHFVSRVIQKSQKFSTYSSHYVSHKTVYPTLRVLQIQVNAKLFEYDQGGMKGCGVKITGDKIGMTYATQ